MMVTIQVRTEAREQFVDITHEVASVLQRSGKGDGVAFVYVPHTTAGVTINENADPDVIRDILFALDKAVPDHREFRHAEGNSTAHVKTSLMGSSVQVPYSSANLSLGTWQSVFLCEFDGPRTRKVIITVR